MTLFHRACPPGPGRDRVHRHELWSVLFVLVGFLQLGVVGSKAEASESAATCVSLATLGHADGFEEWQLQIEVEGELLVEFPRTLQAALVLVSAAEPGSVVWDPHGDSDCLVTEAALICDESGGSISGRSSAALHVLWTSGSAGCEGVGL